MLTTAPGKDQLNGLISCNGVVHAWNDIKSKPEWRAFFQSTAPQRESGFVRSVRRLTCPLNLRRETDSQQVPDVQRPGNTFLLWVARYCSFFLLSSKRYLSAKLCVNTCANLCAEACVNTCAKLCVRACATPCAKPEGQPERQPVRQKKGGFMALVSPVFDFFLQAY